MRKENIDEYTVEAIKKYSEILGTNYYKEKFENNLNSENFGSLLRAADLNNKRGYDIENKPQDIFKILDLPIMN